MIIEPITLGFVCLLARDQAAFWGPEKEAVNCLGEQRQACFVED